MPLARGVLQPAAPPTPQETRDVREVLEAVADTDQVFRQNNPVDEGERVVSQRRGGLATKPDKAAGIQPLQEQELAGPQSKSVQPRPAAAEFQCKSGAATGAGPCALPGAAA